eukprot:s1366_g10.t1
MFVVSVPRLPVDVVAPSAFAHARETYGSERFNDFAAETTGCAHAREQRHSPHLHKHSTPLSSLPFLSFVACFTCAKLLLELYHEAHEWSQRDLERVRQANLHSIRCTCAEKMHFESLLTSPICSILTSQRKQSLPTWVHLVCHVQSLGRALC